jgi:pseudouridine-5'-phosphate glycosidase
VVCAGVKSILDIGLTLEYLETMGVPVIGYNTDEMPAFYSSKSGFKVDFNLKSPFEIAEYLKVKNTLGFKNGVIIAQSIPKEFELDPKVMEEVIEKALLLQYKSGIKGKESTPFLLEKVKELTEGESLISNIALVKNNAKLAAEIAVALCK